MNNPFKSRVLSSIFILSMLLSAVAMPTQNAYADNFNVSSDAELITAINNANANNEDDVITLTANITLTAVDNGSNGLPVVLADGSHSLTIEGDGFTLARDGAAANFRFFEVDTGADLTLNNLTLSNGNSGTLQGGAVSISSGGTVDINDSTFVNNTSAFDSTTAGFAGGAGAIYNGGTLTITGSTFSGNTATGDGGDGGAILSNGAVDITNSTFYNNSAVPLGGTGGAIRLDGGAGPNTITHVTFSDNANDANYGTVDISATSATLSLSILANSTTGFDCSKRGIGTLTSTNNLIENDSAGNTCSPAETSDPGLGALQNNGGNTQTMAITAASPAYNYTATCPLATDQRGISRPQPSGDNCDLGAFELEVPGHTVIFNNNGGSGSMSNQTAFVPTALTLNTFTRTGYTFSGWNTASDGSGTGYADGATYDFSADATLYAQWTALPSHTVTFNANGGTGSMSNQTTNVPTALTLNTFTRTGYSFNGWNTASNGSGTSYADGAVYAFSADATLYAQWGVNSTVASIVRTDGNPTAALSVDFTVTFSDAVSGVDTSDFVLTVAGVSGASISSVTDTGDQTSYTVTVDTGSSNGTIRLDVTDDDTIEDTSNNPLGGVGAGNGDFSAGEIYLVLKAPSFTDVPASHPYYEYIEVLYAYGLTNGCSTVPLKYCPSSIMNRAQVAKFFMTVEYGGSYLPPSDTKLVFKDSWKINPWAKLWANDMYDKGLTNGCKASPLLYCPDNDVIREQVAKFGLAIKYGNAYEPTATGTVFADLTDPGYWATGWAEQAYADGLVPACGMAGGKPKFCPYDEVNRGFAAFVIVTATGLLGP